MVRRVVRTSVARRLLRLRGGGAGQQREAGDGDERDGAYAHREALLAARLGRATAAGVRPRDLI